MQNLVRARVNERKEGPKTYYEVAKSLVSVTTVVSSVDGEDDQAKIMLK